MSRILEYLGIYRFYHSFKVIRIHLSKYYLYDDTLSSQWQLTWWNFMFPFDFISDVLFHINTPYKCSAILMRVVCRWKCWRGLVSRSPSWWSCTGKAAVASAVRRAISPTALKATSPPYKKAFKSNILLKNWIFIVLFMCIHNQPRKPMSAGKRNFSISTSIYTSVLM